MILRIKLSLTINVMHFSPDFNFYAVYSYKGCKCRVEMILESEPKEMSYEGGTFYGAQANSLSFLINDNPDNLIEGLVKQQQWRMLDNFLTSLMNTFLKVFRNKGKVNFLTTICPLPDSYGDNSRLINWEMEQGPNPSNLRKAFSEAPIVFFAPPVFERTLLWNKRYFHTVNWNNILAVLEKGEFDNLLVEDDLIINAEEHLSENRLRLAIIECIGALEIVLDKYLRLFFTRKDISQRYFNEVIGPSGIGLTNKLRVIYPLTEYSSFSELNLVCSLITRRNSAIHKGVDIPVNEKGSISEQIKKTLSLISWIQNCIYSLEHNDDLQLIKKTLAEEFTLPIPSITITKGVWSFVHVSFVILSQVHTYPDEKRLDLIIKRIQDLLFSMDNALRPSRYHSAINFFEYPSGNFLGWLNGKVESKKRDVSLIACPDDPTQFTLKCSD